jgi:hypothetical protein
MEYYTLPPTPRCNMVLSWVLDQRLMLETLYANLGRLIKGITGS